MNPVKSYSGFIKRNITVFSIGAMSSLLLGMVGLGIVSYRAQGPSVIQPAGVVREVVEYEKTIDYSYSDSLRSKIGKLELVLEDQIIKEQLATENLEKLMSDDSVVEQYESFKESFEVSLNQRKEYRDTTNKILYAAGVGCLLGVFGVFSVAAQIKS
jgi:hypothetical protein